MAFVFRAARPDNKISTGDQIGPGLYLDINKVGPIPLIPKNLKPFNSTSQKGGNVTEVKAKEAIPGPGTYNIQQNQMEKVVISSPDEEIKVIEIPKPSPFFKDQQKRFSSQDKLGAPGPGAYCIELPKKNKGKGGSNAIWRPKNVIETLMQINKYSSIPSIPGKQHQFGYTENDQNILELNQLNSNLVDADKNRGPGAYNLPGVFDKKVRPRGISWNSQTQSNGQEDKKNKSFIGPGSYDIFSGQSAPLYKLKQSPAFASRSNRDQRKGEKSFSFLSSKNQQLRESQGTEGFLDDDEESDSEYEYISDATPGPGYYHNESTMSSIRTTGKPEKYQYFGTRQERFQSAKAATGGYVGPGRYDILTPITIGKDIPKQSTSNKTVPFGSSDTRFEMRILEEIKPCPGQYDPRNAFEDRLIYKIQKGYRGNFGSTERRFISNVAKEEIPGPGAYLEPITEKDSEDIKATAPFISKTKRDQPIHKKKQFPAPGEYNVDINDIGRKAQIDEEDDPTLAVKKPGFLSGEARFKEPSKLKKNQNEDDEDEEDDIPITSNKQIADLYRKKPKPPAPFGTKEGRFVTKKAASLVAPGQYYDQIQSGWNKRTFNILFAEI